MKRLKEIWKDIPEYEGMYQVSNFGNVKSLSRKVKHPKGGDKQIKERLLKGCIDNVGYLTVNLRKFGKHKTRRIHQLVAVAFLNHKPCGYKLVINHKDFNPLNNNVDNIEIVTQRKNTNQKHLKSKSKYVGVTWRKDRKKWVATIRIGNKRKRIGTFTNEKDAGKAYKREVKKLENIHIKTIRLKPKTTV